MRQNRVVVTGLGVISPNGNNKDKFWDSLINGRSAVSEITTFDTSEFDTRIAAEVKDFNPVPHLSPKEARRMTKFIQYAVCASRMAIEDAGLDLAKEDLSRIGVLLGSGIGGLQIIEEQHEILLEKGPSRITPFLIPMMIVNMASGQVSIKLGVKGPNSAIATACASGNHALGGAFRAIEYGDADVMLAGGTEGTITPLAIAGFCAMKALSTRNDDPPGACRPFDLERDGFVMGEGAGIVVLESLKHAEKRNAAVYAELCGYGSTADAYHMTAPDTDGDGAVRAMRMALDDAGLPPDAISYINAHGTSTILNDKVETLAIKKVFGDYAYRLPVSSTKSMTGHLLGAAGGVEFVACVMAIKEGIVPPTINYRTPDPDCDLDYVPNTARRVGVKAAMTNSLGFGGHNATLIVKAV